MHKYLLLASLAALTSTLEAQQKPQEKKEPFVPPPKSAADIEKKAEDTSGQEKAVAEFRAMPREYQVLVMESMKRFQARDFTGAMAYVDRADGMQLPTVWTLN